MDGSRHRGKDAVALVALIAAAGWTGWLLARQSLDLNATWTDGERPVSSIGTEAVRHAIWDDPLPLAGDVNGADREGRPAVSPDGRHLVFTVGERGLNAELWIAELVGGEAVDARPLTRLNSAADELAPAFGPDALWFASDRGGSEFGLDLWRAPYADGRFLEPEPAGAGINSGADDTDPFPLPDPATGTVALAFASDRERGARVDYDLYAAVQRPAAESEPDSGAEPEGRRWIVGSLGELNTPFDEREPSLTEDGRTLLFASDRAGRARDGGERTFDLYRSFRGVAGDEGPSSWLPPEPLQGVNTEASERAPLPVDGGFSLLFERAVGADPGDILRARSRELFRLPQPPLSLRDLLILVLLVTLAVLALLAKRWRAIDVLYKCLLVSLLVHLLLLLWFREVVPEPTPVAASDVERTFRVRLAASSGGTASAQRERGGELAAERSQAQDAASTPSRTEARVDLAEQSAAAPAERAAMRSSARPVDAAPSAELVASAADARASTPLASDVATPAALTPAYDGARPEVTLTPSGTANARSAEGLQRADDPGRAQRAELLAAAGPAAPAATGRVVTASARGADVPSAPARRRTEGTESRSTAAPSGVETAGPAAVAASETRAAPGLELANLAPAGGTPARAQVTADAPGRLTGAEVAGTAAFEAAPAARSVQAARDGVEPGADASARSRERLAGPRQGEGTAARTAVAVADPGLPSPADVAAPGELALGGPSANAPARRSAEASGPQRASADGGGASAPATSAAGPRLADLAGLAARRRVEQDGKPSRGTLARGPAASARRTTALAGVADPFGHVDQDGEGSGDAPAGLDLGTLGRTERPSTRGTGEGPTRAGRTVERSEGGPVRAKGPSAMDVSGLLARRGEEQGAAAPARAPGPERAARASAGPTRLRRPEDAPSGADADSPTAASTDGEASALALNASDTGARRSRTGPAGPTRARGTLPREASGPGRTARPEVRPLLAAAPPADETDDGPRRERGQTAYSNRFGEARLRALEEYGGGAETEAAVANGLRYLASIQNDDGGWGDARDYDRAKYRDVRIGKTGLALLAFLGAGHLPEGTTEHAGVTRSAIEHLLGLVHERTGHVGDGASYSNAIATYALAETFAMTEDGPFKERMRVPLERAIARIVVAQDTRDDPRLFGGWGYYYGDGSVWSGDRWPRVSVTAWQVMALESARLGGLYVPDETFDAARTFLARAWDADRGAFRYAHDPTRLRSRYDVLPASTPAALFALSLLDVDLETRELRDAWRFLAERRPSGYRYEGDDAFVFRARGNLYFWYYGSLASFRRGGDTWERWNVAMQETLLPSQEEDGSWRPLSTYADYAGDDDDERTYTTAMCVLTLEVYYRYFTPLLRVR